MKKPDVFWCFQEVMEHWEKQFFIGVLIKTCLLHIFRAPFYKNAYGGLLLHWLEIGWKSLGLLLLKQQFICLATQVVVMACVEENIIISLHYLISLWFKFEETGYFIHEEIRYVINPWNNSPEVFLGEGVLKICRKFTEHPCRTLRDASSPVNLLHIFRIPFYENTYGRVLLNPWE